DGLRKKGDEADEKGGGNGQAVEYGGARETVGHASTDIVADGEIKQDESDEIRPDEERGAEIGGKQTRGRELHSQRARARDDNQQDKYPALYCPAGSGDDGGLAGPGLLWTGASGGHRDTRFLRAWISACIYSYSGCQRTAFYAARQAVGKVVYDCHVL